MTMHNPSIKLVPYGPPPKPDADTASSKSSLNPTRAALLQNFALDRPMTAGRGWSLFDDMGTEYLDFLSQYGALIFGHNPPEIWEALCALRSEEAPAMIQPLRSLEAERLANRLCSIAPGDIEHCVFANSGAETVEAAIKLARSRSGRNVILSTTNGFHGKTLGALSATGKDLYQADFAAPAPDFEYIPYGDLDALESRLKASGDRIAAFIFEPIQGEGGVVAPPEGYVDAAIALCRSYGVLSIVDEIQTGLGRTGALFAVSEGQQTPDMLLLAKALGGGLVPIGACLVRGEVWDDRFGLLHSSTFAGNALACRAGNATLDKLLSGNSEIIREVAGNGAYFAERLHALRDAYPETVRSVRGRGYMVGLEFQDLEQRDDSATMAYCSLNRGVTPLLASYLANAHHVVTAPLFNQSFILRLQPALIVGRAQIDRAVAALATMCEELERRNYAALLRHIPGNTPKQPAPHQLSDRTFPAPQRRQKAVPDKRRFGFLIHYTEEEDMLRSDPSFKTFSRDEREDLRGWMKRLGPGLVRRVAPITSPTGATAEGFVLSVPLLPDEMRARGRNGALPMVEGAVDLAVETGLGRFGLGAFTSIVSRGGEAVTGRGASITSGNTLTSVVAVESVRQVARRLGRDLTRANIAIIGATGAIGGLCARLLASEAGELTLVGNPANPFSAKFLDRIRSQIRIDGDCRAERITCTTDLNDALARADIVLVATNSDAALIDPLRLRPGTVVCDIARPPNVAEVDLTNTGVLVYDGGLVQPPVPVDLGPFQTLPQGLCWGCLGETMLLALAGESGDYSIGSTLSLDQARRIRTLAAEHNFRPAPVQWYGKLVDDDVVEECRTAQDQRPHQPNRRLAIDLAL